MTTTKHTLGPWTMYERPEPIGYAAFEVHYGTDMECVAEVVHHEANARLMAAAPDLLAALQQALYQMEHDAEKIESEWGVGRKLADLEADDEMPEVIIRARAAIAKATGRQA